ncbi:Gfo/Idh/MocA family protein [Streptomyces sp. 4N509B]|uniref:Gfo/Idh/MocA family protein n=1 Tax=Streptomyces sp. 4N509B TaxID=3457413 RepID=UPI003FCF9AF0
MPARPVYVAVVGCGFVSDFYLDGLADHPGLALAGVHDLLPERAARVARRHGVRVYEDLPRLLADERVSVVLNLTPPKAHAGVTLAALAAGRHVYSEKPLATTLADGREIVEEAERRGLLVACAPSNVLGEAFQTLWREVRAHVVATPRLVYAELDDGAVHRMGYERWRNATGSPWPYREEFAAGCNVEHSSYHLATLTTLFGPVRRVVADRATLVRDKFPPGEEGPLGPDFVTATLTFDGGPLARLTCSTIAPVDRSLTVVGDGGVLRMADCWDHGTPVTLREAAGRRSAYLGPPRPVEPVRPFAPRSHHASGHRMDFPRGVADLAEAATLGRPPRLSARHALHVLEVTLAMGSADGAVDIASEFPPPEPMPWARDS